ncbi:myo-inositol-1(or 4)-monophosphatase [Cognatiyoonia koreensis]|uniref:Myo-inositol-1(Or 4)-monophosphatase n=1 Tax=Cognatiyoonia koreensis TaxID=364200 RepID=A0A1I0RU52_9RHOB|nr:3'(2'),5'-bisphosphate nucleotidase CysQ [Cognatiyoonia koreensis]SEW44962.1 myo-inositol-1(or 4)-monophosphatase [Cognatiyoonia koreensis]
MPETDLALLLEAGQKAGEIASSYFGRDPRIWNKDDNAGPVTEADLAVNAHLAAVLQAARPDYGWLSEESEDAKARLTTRRQFVIDPIDGTRAFIERSRDWAISLAIVEDGVPLVGVVIMPERGKTYAALRGQGATLNGSRLSVTGQADLAAATVLTNKITMQPDFWKGGVTPPIKRTFRSSLAYRLCLVAEARFDAMMTLRPTWEWDIAAGALIVAEAGGTVTDRQARPLRLNNQMPQVNGVIAAGPVHRAIASALI